MRKNIPSQKIFAAVSKIVPTELGIFAKLRIAKGEIIEICPIIAISKDDTAAIHESSLVSYMFYYGKKKDKSLIALGYGSLYNHSDTPNASYNIHPKKKSIIFTALVDINMNEEITVSYANTTQNPLWFAIKT